MLIKKTLAAGLIAATLFVSGVASAHEPRGDFFPDYPLPYDVEGIEFISHRAPPDGRALFRENFVVGHDPAGQGIIGYWDGEHAPFLDRQNRYGSP